MAEAPAAHGAGAINTNALQQFIAESKLRLQTILSRLQWSVEDVEKAFNANARTCAETEAPVTYEEPKFPPSCANTNSLVIAPDELRQLVGAEDVQVPENFSDLQLNFTREQKLSIYEHVAQHTKKCIEPDITVPALGEGNLTFAEIVAQKKRERKKRRRYRRSKPTQIEEVRGLVDLQMQALQQYMEAKAAEERKQQRALRRSPEHNCYGRREQGHTDRRDHRAARRRSRSKSRKRSGSRNGNRNKSRSRLRVDDESTSRKRERRKEQRRSRSKVRSHSKSHKKMHKRSRSRSRHKSHKHKRRKSQRSRSRSPTHSHSYNRSHKASKHLDNNQRHGSADGRKLHVEYNRSHTSRSGRYE